MARLNQLLAVRKGVQSEVHAATTALHRDSQKQQLMTGFTRTYRKILDDDADLPGETQKVQVRADEALGTAVGQWTRLWDTTAQVDWTNCAARADVVIGETVLVRQAPVAWLLFMEKQLKELHEFVAKVATLDPAEEWTWDGNAGAYATGRSTTVRTKKIPRNHVLAEATDRHPAQVQVWQEDVPVGYWDTIKFSGALDGDRRKTLLARITALREAIKTAREEANMTEVVPIRPSSSLFAYVLAP